MALWWILFMFTFSNGFEQKNCGRPFFPAPDFNDNDNLSTEECGIWDQENNKHAPWYVSLRKSSGVAGCWGTLLSKSSILSDHCEWNADPDSGKTDVWKAYLGKCAVTQNKKSCTANGNGQIVKVRRVTELEAPGFPYSLYIWKIEKVTFKENYIAPVCIYNKGNQQDSNKTQRYEALYYDWDGKNTISADLSEDFGPCLKESRNFKACDVEHDNFLCVRLPRVYNWLWYLTHQENNRHFFRGLAVEESYSRDKFYYELHALLDQIVLKSGDIPLMPKSPEVKEIFDFGAGQSFPGCGTLMDNTRIVGGEDAIPNAQPWYAYLEFVNTDESYCGATLISTTALVTAAHCVVNEDGNPMNPSDIDVTVGLYDLDAESNVQIVNAEFVFIHEEYIPKLYDNDVAVVLVADPGFEITAFVRPICLWNQDYDFKHIENSSGQVVGFGVVDKNNTRPDILQTADLTVLPYRDCYLRHRVFFSKFLKPGHNFCAGGDGVTACSGDSGGGFFMENDGKWFLRGVVSSGKTRKMVIDGKNITACIAKLPSLYTDVTNYMDWIVGIGGL